MVIKNKAVFLDRDGVINNMVYYQDHGLIDSPFLVKQFSICPGVKEAIRLIHEMGMKAILVSNQPGIAKGFYSLKNLAMINKKMNRLLNGASSLDGMYYCLHHPEARIKKYKMACSCRKPKPGLLIKACRENNVDLKRSYMIGDGITDIEAGKEAGCKTILIGRPKCDLCSMLSSKGLKPDAIAGNLLEAVSKIKKWEGYDGDIHRHRRRK
ncbi:MAG: HAD family hydrolase [Candidatus Omnitrophota bacterium]